MKIIYYSFSFEVLLFIVNFKIKKKSKKSIYIMLNTFIPEYHINVRIQ